MSSTELIESLEREGYLKESLLRKLREKTASSEKPMSAASLAKFLVDKGHLTKEQAARLLAKEQEAPRPEVEEGFVAVDVEPLSPPTQTADPPAPIEKREREPRKRDRPARSSSREQRTERRRRVKPARSEWDSPLILMGGGLLVILLLVGGATGYLLFRDSGDDLLKVAQEDFKSGSYSNAITNYERFLEEFPSHGGVSEAKVQLGLAKLRQGVEVAKDYEGALETAKQVLPEMAQQDEAYKDEQQREVESLLPQIALGLATRAEASDDRPQVAGYVEKATEALAMSLSTQYIPKSYQIGAKRDSVRQILDRIERREVALSDLEAALTAMSGAVSGGDTKAAYAAHAEFAKSHPELASNDRLNEAVVATSKAEKAGIEFIADEQPAITTPAESPVVAELAVAQQRVTGAAPAEGEVSFAFNGVAYGINAADGRLLWRRSIGAAIPAAAPVELKDGSVLLVNAESQELVCLQGESGNLLWRQPLDAAASTPIVNGGRAFVATGSGQMFVFDVSSGIRLGFVQFAQPLWLTPTIGASDSRIYVIGEHSSLYTLDAETLDCLDVYYLGHAPESVNAPMSAVFNKLILVENDGVESSQLKVLSLDSDGVPEGVAAERRLDGLVDQQPIAEGRRFVVVTDDGFLGVYQIGIDAEEPPLTELARREPSRTQRGSRFAAIAGGHLWIADNRLSKYSVAPSGNRLPIVEIANPLGGGLFVGPIVQRGEALLHIRRRSGQPGATVSATELKSGRVLWETDIAVPPAGAPAAQSAPVGVTTATADGRVFRFDREAILSRVRNVSQSGAVSPGFYANATRTASSHVVYSAPESSSVLCSGATGETTIVELPGKLACEPTAMADGWLAPIEVGQVLFLDPANGQPLAAPFQPPVAPSSTVCWRTAGVTDEGLAVISDGGQKVYALELVLQPSRRLQLVSDATLPNAAAATRVATAGDRAVIGLDNGSIVVLELPSLEIAAELPVGGAVIWGPYAVGNAVLAATEADQLLCLDPASPNAPVWQVDFMAADAIGDPLQSAQSAVVAMRTGRLVRFDMATGERLAEADLGQTVGAGPAEWENRLMLAANDGAVLIVNLP